MPIEKSLLSVRDLLRSTFDSKFEKSTFGTGEEKSTTSNRDLLIEEEP